MSELTLWDHRKAFYAPRVEVGAQLLDSELPGWFERIDLDQLCLSDGCRCVLGQLYGEQDEEGIFVSDAYIEAAQKLIGNHELPRFFGFVKDQAWYLKIMGEIRDYIGYFDNELEWRYARHINNIEWAVLDELWIEQVKARYESNAATHVLG